MTGTARELPTSAHPPVAPTRFQIDEPVLADLRERLSRTRWADDRGNETGVYGVPGDLLRRLAEHWLDGFDWRAAEERINAYQHLFVDVDGLTIHVMRRPGVGPRPIPLAGNFASTLRIYADNNRHPWRPSHDRRPQVQAPTGLTLVGHENPPGVTTDRRVDFHLGTDRAAWYDLVNVTAHDAGGHFIPWEIPDAWVDDLRRTFAGRR
jgi:hypothetical protein